MHFLKHRHKNSRLISCGRIAPAIANKNDAEPPINCVMQKNYYEEPTRDEAGPRAQVALSNPNLDGVSRVSKRKVVAPVLIGSDKELFTATRKNSYLTKNLKISNSRRRNMPSPASQLLSLLISPPFIITLLLALIQQSSVAQQTVRQPQSSTYLLTNHNLENLHISEATKFDTIVHQLKARDSRNPDRKFNYSLASDYLKVDDQSGEIRLVKELDREKKSEFSAVVSVLDANDSNGEVVESRRRTIYVDDIDDSWPQFQPHRTASLNIGKLNQQDLSSRILYKVEIPETLPPGSLILGDITVTDADEPKNVDLIFECSPKNFTTCETFTLDSRRMNHGKYVLSVKTKVPLDYEQVQSYMMTLVARSRNPSPMTGKPLQTETILEIKVINVQDEAPIFQNAPYSISVREGEPRGTRLLEIQVQDGDLAPQRQIKAIVVTGPFSKYFHLSKGDLNNIWYLETTEIVIDREDPSISSIGNVFDISLLAAETNETGYIIASDDELNHASSDQSSSKGSAKKAIVTVVIEDKLDSAPFFVQASTGKDLDGLELVYNISESIMAGSSLPNLDLAVMDLDLAMNSHFNLTSMDSDIGPPASLAFEIEPQLIYGRAEVVIKVMNASLIDYEDSNLRVYRFNLVASKMGSGSASTLIKVLPIQINIIDSNDNWPEFERSQYLIEVQEDAKPGTQIGQIQAHDNDSNLNGKLRYTLSGKGSNNFRVGQEDGAIFVIDCGKPHCIDYEIEQSYSLIYEANDGGNKTSQISLIINVIDVNDHVPRFTELIYKRELISDNLSSKQNYISPQLIVKARDEDRFNNVTYSIRSTNLTGLDVHRHSGLVYLSEPFDLDYLIASLAEKKNTQDSNLALRRILFEAEVLASDNGNPPLQSSAKIHLTVRGNRDGAPQFKQNSYVAYVSESHPINKSFFQVQAQDPDEKDTQLRYSLGNDLNDILQINAQTGELSFKQRIDYDELNGLPYNVTVYATDSSKPQPLKVSAPVTVIVQDVNNKPPRFVEHDYRIRLIQAKTKPGDVLVQVKALDPDRTAKLNYSIEFDHISVRDRNGFEFNVSSLLSNPISNIAQQMTKQESHELIKNLRNLIAINKTTGAIILKSEPDYAFAASITIPIKVVDLAQDMSISANNSSLQHDTTNCTFLLQTHVDTSPIFAPPWTISNRDYNISILEEMPTGSHIFSLVAKDPLTNQKIELFEKIFESDPKSYFRVDRQGMVSIDKRIDYEQLMPPRRLRLAVKAISAEQYFSVANLNIQIVDINDNAPYFKMEGKNYQVEISESIQYPSEIITVQAEDKDQPETNKIHYSLSSSFESKYFQIDPRKGVISLRKDAKLDREIEPVHNLVVTASDCNETPSTTTTTTIASTNIGSTQLSNCRKNSTIVKIILIDENDNDPIFLNTNQKSEYETSISETIAVGSIIYHVQAKDLDQGPNGRVNYDILINPEEQITRQITIDNDGYIRVVESLSGLGRYDRPYRITIKAYDDGKQPRQSLSTLVLHVGDVVENDGIPRIITPQANEIVYISESAGPNTFVYQVKAEDPEAKMENSKVMYRFDKPSNYFVLDPFEGVVKTIDRPNVGLDREKQPNHTLIIIVHDLQSPTKQNSLILNIRLTDVNDNEPIFERGVDNGPVNFSINEEVAKDTLVGIVQAHDRDIGQNALIDYEIIDGNQNNSFWINFEPDPSQLMNGNNPCRIYTNGRLDREQRDSYTLTIKASSFSKRGNPFNAFQHQNKLDPLPGRNNPFNQYNPRELNKIRVTIKLIDINDNRPTFIETNIKSIVDSSAQVYSQLMSFKAYDPDSSNSEIQYSLLDVLFHSDSKSNRFSREIGKHAYGSVNTPMSVRGVFDIDPRKGILRNVVSLRPYIDGHFEVFVKADSGQYNAKDDTNMIDVGKCAESSTGDLNITDGKLTTTKSTGKPYGDLENCLVAVTKGVVFVTQQRETFRFVFNKTKLNDRFEEFKTKIERALEEIAIDMTQAAPSTSVSEKSFNSRIEPMEKFTGAEKLVLNTFNAEFYEREDGSLDFSTFTSCSQLIKFDDQQNNQQADSDGRQSLPHMPQAINYGQQSANHLSLDQRPTQVVNYDQVLNLLKTLNQTQTRHQSKVPSLFSQYGLVNIERCLPNDRTHYRMSLSEKVSLYLAGSIAVFGMLLTLIVSQMRKSYEKNLRILQRSRYQYMWNWEQQ